MSDETRRLPRGLQPPVRRRQRRTLWLTMIAATGIAALAPLATIVSEGRISTMELLGDPAELTGQPWYLGAVNTVNLHLWAAGVALYLVAGFGGRQRDRRLGNALLWLSLLTSLILTDDEFLLHEIVFPWLFGVPELVTFGLYGAALVTILLRYHTVLLEQPEASLLMLGTVSLGASVALDIVGWDTTTRRFAEEACKLLGALAWTTYPAAILIRWLVPPLPPER